MSKWKLSEILVSELGRNEYLDCPLGCHFDHNVTATRFRFEIVCTLMFHVSDDSKLIPK